jgi:hypothetical protein
MAGTLSFRPTGSLDLDQTGSDFLPERGYAASFAKKRRPPA